MDKEHTRYGADMVVITRAENGYIVTLRLWTGAECRAASGWARSAKAISRERDRSECPSQAARRPTRPPA